MIKISSEGKIIVPSKEFNIIFICTGNTCRSPMCAALFNSCYGNYTVQADSAGLFADGSPISENAVQVLNNIGIKVSPFLKSRSVTENDLQKADFIVCVTRSHSLTLVSRYPKYADKIGYMPLDITDPFGGDINEYRRCLEDIKKNFGMIFEKSEAKEKSN